MGIPRARPAAGLTVSTKTASRLIKLIGWNETLTLLRTYGGKALYVHIDPECSPLQCLLSDDAVELLCDLYGGDTIDLPKPDKMQAALRDKEIAEQAMGPAKLEHDPRTGLYRMNRSRTDARRLAHIYGVSERHIRRIIAAQSGHVSD